MCHRELNDKAEDFSNCRKDQNQDISPPSSLVPAVDDVIKLKPKLHPQVVRGFAGVPSPAQQGDDEETRNHERPPHFTA